jgi:DNA-binding protein H-NS
MTDLSDYNFGELKGLLFEVDKELRARQRQATAQARERILAIAREAGVPAQQLLSDEAGARYRNPLDASQTWSGRGRQPKWVAAALDEGRTLDDLAS